MKIMRQKNRKGRHAPLTRAMRVLVYLCDHRFGGTIADLADECGVSMRETYRYLNAIEAAGIPIERARRGPGMNMIRLRDRRWLAERLGVI